MAPPPSSISSDTPTSLSHVIRDPAILKSKQADKMERQRKISALAKDQYENGIAASVWEEYIGEDRASRYRDWVVNTLKENNVTKVLDVACGTGIDSRMLVEAGFQVTSCDLSENMLAKAKDIRKKKNFKDWDIRQADWCKLPKHLGPEVAHDFDAVICMGNSFAHLPDDLEKQQKQTLAITNFREMLKPGGLLIIDHRNFDFIVKHGKSPAQNVYYKSTWQTRVDTSLVRNASGDVTSVDLDYWMTVPIAVQRKMNIDLDEDHDQINFQLTYFPHYLDSFKKLLRKVFEVKESEADHAIYGDFLPLDETEDPAYFIHVVPKAERRSASESSTESSTEADGLER